MLNMTLHELCSSFNEAQDADLDAEGHVAPETLVHVHELLVPQAADVRDGSSRVQAPEEALLIEIVGAVHAAAFELHRETRGEKKEVRVRVTARRRGT